MLRNYYKDLELDKSANIEDIKKSFRRLALLYHPDKDNSLSANQKFNEINEAYQVLSDSDKRSKYDSAYSAQFNPFVTYVEAPSTQNWAYHHKRKVKYVVERKVKYSYQSKRNAHYFLLLSLLFVLLIFIDALLPKKKYQTQ
jgi:DnaJ-class molecular chaperone